MTIFFVPSGKRHFCGIYDFYVFVRGDQAAHNLLSYLCRPSEEKISEHAMACHSLPALHLVRVVIVFMQCPQLFFFC